MRYMPYLLPALALCLGGYITPALADGSACGVPALESCPKPVDKSLPDVKDMLTWSQHDRVIGFRNDFRSYTGDVFKHGRATPLPHERRDISHLKYVFEGKSYNLSDYFRRNNVNGFLVIKNNKIVYEYFDGGNNKTTLWTSRSVGKSVVSTLVGIAVKEGRIHSLDDKVSRYNPDVRNTVWADVTLRQLMQHTSGVTWDENYQNPKSDFAQLTQCEASKNAYACVHDLVLNPKRKAYAKPGQVWSYSSGSAWLLGDTLEKATGVSLAQYLQEKIWIPYGMAHDGVWHSYEKGRHDVGAHGFNATLEDWGRFGLFVLNNGVLPNGKKMLPDNWVKEAGTWNKAKNSVTPGYPNGRYGYQWWNNSVPLDAKDVAPKEGMSGQDTLWALGIFGQIIAVNPAHDLVIVQWSTWPVAEPSFNKQPLEASLMFNAIANGLK